MTVYIDILFFVNFFMNYLVISVLEGLVAKGVKKKRKLLASFLGGIYGVFSFIPDLAFIYSSFSAFLFSGILVTILFYPFNMREFLKYILIFYISSFIFAGGIYMILPHIGGGIIRNNVIYYDILGVIIPAVGIFFAAGKMMAYIKNNRKKNGYRISIKYRENEAFFDGFLDTGNLLYEPFSGKAVVVADESVLKKLFSEECSINNITEWVESTDIRIIPYKTLDSEGVMLGFLAEKISVDKRVLENVTVAISPKVIKEGILINDGVF